ncbi:hypothetical protein BD289DRAFT_136856 [Coniella lustricola]|uniref:Secreted protein n=1 Tax=Coniella lustricola TaxID=2025994 RepID=A0A2T3AFP1_9PEZI|nr:hypothetical protein BD289DRAFT_136856 [Coniella lustricola]
MAPRFMRVATAAAYLLSITLSAGGRTGRKYTVPPAPNNLTRGSNLEYSYGQFSEKKRISTRFPFMSRSRFYVTVFEHRSGVWIPRQEGLASSQRVPSIVQFPLHFCYFLVNATTSVAHIGSSHILFRCSWGSIDTLTSRVC